jgi:hypothetical protein
VLRYHRRSKVGKGAQMDASLFDEAVTAISAPTAPSLGAFSSPWRDRGLVLAKAKWGKWSKSLLRLAFFGEAFFSQAFPG